MKLDINLEDAFNVGHLEGSKETLRELQNVLDFEDLKAARIYIKARLKSLEQLTNLPGRLKDVSYNPGSLRSLQGDAPSGRNGGNE